MYNILGTIPILFFAGNSHSNIFTQLSMFVYCICTIHHIYIFFISGWDKYRPISISRSHWLQPEVGTRHICTGRWGGSSSGEPGEKILGVILSIAHTWTSLSSLGFFDSNENGQFVIVKKCISKCNKNVPSQRTLS